MTTTRIEIIGTEIRSYDPTRFRWMWLHDGGVWRPTVYQCPSLREGLEWLKHADRKKGGLCGAGAR